MPRPSALPVAALAMAVALAGAPARAQEPAKDPAKPVKRLTMSLEKVLPLLNAAVVRVRTPSEGRWRPATPPSRRPATASPPPT